LDDAEISFVFQEDRLLPRLSVLENVMLPIRRSMGKAEAENRARHFLRLAGLEEIVNSYPSRLSGGQRQRVSVARAWAYPSRVILMDEPFQSLDIPRRIALMDAVRGLLSAENRTLIMVTHDPRDALYMGRRIVVLSSNGSVVFDQSDESALEKRQYAAFNPMEEIILKALDKQ